MHAHRKAEINRISRAIGHLSAVKRMLEDDRDCAEILVQLSAVKAEINGLSKVILKDHIDHCVVDAVKEDDGETIERLKEAIDKLL